ncbi:MAG: proline--tRNA ligase [Thermoleophilaceae bacterium]|nr:proline--tRNA ligase [Thermoleophilaceae bacterium]
MTRLSQYLLPTEKQAPADAEAISHKLMVRAGLIRQMGAGLWSYLPAGWRVQRKIEQIIREEMDRAGALEMLMPVIQPAELWQKTGRYEISELFKLKDRKDADLVLAMTHEEAVTNHVAREVRSYRDLPLTLYHFQTKGRDEPRPRAGVLRTREFTMKDAYSFDRDEDGLQRSYDIQAAAYKRIFDRVGLEWYMVESDVGMMGGSGADEFMAPCAAGENDIALAPGYAANVEVASATAAVRVPGPALDSHEEVATPGQTTIEAVAAALDVQASTLLKAMPMIDELDGKPLLVMLRGDHTLNEIKLQNAIGRPLRQAGDTEIEEHFRSPVGFTGPVGQSVRIVTDRACEGDAGGWITGANKLDAHLRGVEIGRDFQTEFADVRNVVAGDLTPGGHQLEIVPAIEIGNIFKLGTRYSEALGASFLDEEGKEHPVVMGSYGIGPARIAAAIVEQLADDAGIVWPSAIAPFQVHMVVLGKDPDGPERKAADALYEELLGAGVEVIYDDRDGGPGAKFADAELLGCPLRVTLGARSLESGELELQIRRGRENKTIPLEGAAQSVVAALAAID